MSRGLLLAAGLALLAGCSLPRSGLGPGADGGADAGPGGCRNDSECPPGQRCVLRMCIDPSTDMDGDGIPADIDCNDSDPSVGSHAERGCRSACADGLERCTDAVWEPCDAPTDCDCTPGETRMLDCTMCGTQMQMCDAGGTWQDVGGCEDQGVCTPGALETIPGTCGWCGMRQHTCMPDCSWSTEVCVAEGMCDPGTTDTEMESCGLCMSGTHTRSRTCTSTCDWGAFDAWGACTGETGCMPGTIETDSLPCGMCGTQDRTRTCQDDCTFGPWGSFGACMGESGTCLPGAMEMRTGSCGTCSTGSQGETRTCDSSCGWGSWMATSACTGVVFCTDGRGRTRCPSETGCMRGPCPSGEIQCCTCSSTGSWVSCGGCFDPG